MNRAPVVAEVLGFEHEEALTLGGAVAGLTAYSKGVSLEFCQPTPREAKGLTGKAYGLCEKFRPEIPFGKKGRGASGKLDLSLLHEWAST